MVGGLRTGGRRSEERGRSVTAGGGCRSGSDGGRRRWPDGGRLGAGRSAADGTSPPPGHGAETHT